MSEDFHDKLGEHLDRALGDGMGLYFKPDWHPKKVVQ
jgi:hypothetical protein